MLTNHIKICRERKRNIQKMIREMKPQDLEDVLTIWLETNTEAHDFIHACYWQNQLAAVREAMAQAEVYVLEEEKIIGFIGLAQDYVAGIFIKPGQQSNGSGKKLLDYVKSLKPELSLQVYEKNQRAVSFYKREGFVLQGEDIDAQTGEKEFLMRWFRI